LTITYFSLFENRRLNAKNSTMKSAIDVDRNTNLNGFAAETDPKISPNKADPINWPELVKMVSIPCEMALSSALVTFSMMYLKELPARMDKPNPTKTPLV
jgi:hypothetical protein